MQFKILETCTNELALSIRCLQFFLERHQRGDWGCIDAVTQRRNQLSIREGGQVSSHFPVGSLYLVIVSTVKAGFASTKVSLNHPCFREVQHDN